ncbi:MAG: hypothetical protein GEU68_01445 [Actinobacteria bacterium]|nr:hypothetical protein [Actinomycetota bacterium]
MRVCRSDRSSRAVRPTKPLSYACRLNSNKQGPGRANSPPCPDPILSAGAPAKRARRHKEERNGPRYPEHMPSLPSGTVTFLFSDIEGSTQLLKQLGDDFAALLADHRSILRDTFGKHGGHEIDTQGDAFFYAFPRAHAAVAGAVEAQRALAAHEWPDGTAVRVRIGLHTGEPVLGQEGFTGIDVVRAARIGPSPRAARSFSARRRGLSPPPTSPMVWASVPSVPGG